MLNVLLRRALATAGLLVTLGLAMAAFAPVASASPYCHVTLPAFGECDGAPRLLVGVGGVGLQHAVCVWADNLPEACSSGPGAVASISYGSAAVRAPKIRNLGSTPNMVLGETF